MAGAAFFDLDRTLLQGASGPVMSEALRDAGILTSSKSPIEDALFGLFDLVGENRPSMVLARLGVRFSKGWDAAAAADAGRSAAERLEPMIQPYARQLIDWHHGEGRSVVMATTSPYPMCAHLGELLGLDDVIATSYGVDKGKYDGTVDGHYVWGPGKRDAVVEWCDANDVNLDESYAYSDSRYDLPLMRAVAHPVAVNPDPRLLVIATAARWPVLYLDVPPGVPKVAGLVEPQKALLAMARSEMVPYARFDIGGTDHLPAEGPVIVAANHRSYFDPLAIGMTLARTGRPARFLAKKEVFDAPVVGQVVKALGTIRVDRGSGSSTPLNQALEALSAGEVVVILPEGTIPRGPAFFEPQLEGRRGVAELARKSGAPVVPLGIWGTENVWPRNSKLPMVWNVTSPPTVTVRMGAPVDLSDFVKAPKASKKKAGKESKAKVSKKSESAIKAREASIVRTVMDSISELLPEESREIVSPTDEQLARTYPSGAQPEVAVKG
ncbi:MAG: HAD-IB family hydrolase [Acidimicrobiales bacterium]